MEEKESSEVKVDSDEASRLFEEAIHKAAEHFSDGDHRRRILRLAKYGVAYAFAVMGKLQASLLKEMADDSLKSANKKALTALHNLDQAALSVIKPGTGLDANSPIDSPIGGK